MGEQLVGIDEAGLGPIIGPLGIAMVSVTAADRPSMITAMRTMAPAVTDSKAIHKPGNLAPLETVALAIVKWVTGSVPKTAAEYFALAGETDMDRQACPWMNGADDLTLPVQAKDIPDWSSPDLSNPALHLRLVHPRTINEAKEEGINRSTLELDYIKVLLQQLPQTPSDIVVDRLGGRKFYLEALQETWPHAQLAIANEGKGASQYQISGPMSGTISFQVKAELACPLTAMASCLAKYGRELHMLLLNRYWSGRFAWLKATAGYPQDAKRWIYQLGTGNIGAWGKDLIRGSIPSTNNN